MKSKVENAVFESRLDSDSFSPKPPTVLTLKTNKTAQMMLFPVETGPDRHEQRMTEELLKTRKEASFR